MCFYALFKVMGNSTETCGRVLPGLTLLQLGAAPQTGNSSLNRVLIKPGSKI